MEGGEENIEQFKISLRVNGDSRDLMNGCVTENHSLRENEEKMEEKDEEIELSLGLSMNGRFGVDPVRKKLRRYSSVSNLGFPVDAAGDNGSGYQARGVALESYAPLGRTCSLPAETEEWRHRKVLQSSMSMEARKKRMEKLKNGRLQVKDYKENCLDNCNEMLEVVNGNEIGQTIIDNAPLNVIENGYTKILPSQGSIGSQGSGSSGISDVQSQQAEEGTKQIAEVKSPCSIKSVRDQGCQKPPIDTSNAEAMGPSASLKNAMLDMPFVSTKEIGSNGNKVDGFLYRFKKGEEVRIVCVCHGMFLSPAEFVKHGGGGDVEHPLKHIVVNPSPMF